MPSYIVSYNSGFGFLYDVVDAKDEDEASYIAYELAKEDFEMQVDYGCLGLETEELREEVGLY